MFDVINTVFMDKEVRDYLSAIVDSGCRINPMMLADLKRFNDGRLNKDELLKYLELAWEWQKHWQLKGDAHGKTYQ